MAAKFSSSKQATPIFTSAKKSPGHTQAKAPIIPLSSPGRLRVSHLLGLLGVSHSTLYAGIQSGRYPQPDGRDGKLPFWNTATILAFLQRNSQKR